MRILIAEDDMVSRKILYKILSKFGECDLTINGIEAVEAFIMAHDTNSPYDLVCLDIMMPKIDGITALKAIRDVEKQKGLDKSRQCKAIMVSALDETEVVYNSFTTGSEAYATKPINEEKLINVLKRLGFVLERK
jgi:two-component system chemotaxis response regulator CheY